MRTPARPPGRLLPVVALLAVTVSGCSAGAADDTATAAASDVRVVQLGAPGEANRTLSPEEVEALPGLPEPAPADIAFVQAMVPHHQQALQMTALVPDRASDEGVRLVAERMEISQEGEIEQMQDWLLERGEVFGEDGQHHTGELMPGMLTAEQLAALEAASGAEFDRLFLESMIQHHEGAVAMVEELFAGEDGGQDPGVFALASHIDSDQRTELARMRDMLAELDAR